MKKVLFLIALFASVATITFAQTTKTGKGQSKGKAAKTTTKKVAASTTTTTATRPAPAAHLAGAVAQFETTEVDYGKIKQGSEPLRIFTFKNIGSEPLTISNAQGSCGCTVPTWPKEPIMPGQTSKIEVRYDTQRVGPFSKSVTLTTNEANPTRVLSIKGDVEAKPAENTAQPTTPAKGK